MHRAGPTVLEQNPKVENMKDQVLQVPVSCGEQMCFHPESSGEALHCSKQGKPKKTSGVNCFLGWWSGKDDRVGGWEEAAERFRRDMMG